MRMPRAGCAAALVTGLLVASAAAQVPNKPAPRLLNATTLRCTFGAMATGTWKDGVAEATTKPAKLSIGFNEVSTEDGTAEAVGDSGKSHITVRAVGNYLNLMQMDPYGALYVTTVFNTETKNGKFLAVHTRHEYLRVQVPSLTSRPEQYYGDCEVK